MREAILAERFWNKVRKTGSEKDCWVWIAGKNKNGYGQFSAKELGGQPMMLAHRVAWQLTNGPIPDGLWVLHECDNPPCCNPAHHFLGTQQDNMADASMKGRTPKGKKSGAYTHPESVPKGENHSNSKLTEEQVRRIRSLYSTAKFTKLKLAEMFSINNSHIASIISRKAWAHI